MVHFIAQNILNQNNQQDLFFLKKIHHKFRLASSIVINNDIISWYKVISQMNKDKDKMLFTNKLLTRFVCVSDAKRAQLSVPVTHNIMILYRLLHVSSQFKSWIRPCHHECYKHKYTKCIDKICDWYRYWDLIKEYLRK